MTTRNTHLMLERVAQIHQKISSNTYPNQVTLAKELEVSVPTISRDIAFLKDRFNAPIDYDRSHNGYYYTEPFLINEFDISPETIQVLATIKSLFSYFSMTPIYNDAKNILSLLTSSFIKISNVDITQRIALPPRSKVQLNQDFWYNIVDAMEKNLIVEFEYQRPTDNKTTIRRVEPYQILIDDGACYLFGFSQERQDERVFAFSRMKNLKITKENFILPKDFDFANRCGGGKFGLFSSGEKQQLSIEFFGNARQIIKERIWADDQIIKENLEQQSLTLTFSSTQEQKVLEWILSYGANARPIAPESFVKKWQNEVEKMYASFN